MEQEFKWKATPAQHAAMRADAGLLAICTAEQQFHMQAIYYETADGLLRQHNAALRLRRENARSVCCMKQGKRVVAEGCTMRSEYETEAQDVIEGLKMLPAAGAPAELCALLLHAELRELAHTDFQRTALTLAYETNGKRCIAELALDSGKLGNQDAEHPFTEAELEYKTGDTAAFHTLAEQIAAQFSLKPQPLSKLARAVAAR